MVKNDYIPINSIIGLVDASKDLNAVFSLSLINMHLCQYHNDTKACKNIESIYDNYKSLNQGFEKYKNSMTTSLNK